MIDAQKALEILFRIPNIIPIWFYSCTYEELVDMHDYEVFPISKQEVDDLKEFIKNNETLRLCLETFSNEALEDMEREAEENFKMQLGIQMCDDDGE